MSTLMSTLMSTIASTITAGEADFAEDLARFDARRGESRRADSSAARMSRTLRRAATAVALVALGAGCADAWSPSDPWALPGDARLVPTSEVVEGTGSTLAYYSGIETAEHGVVRDSAAWAALWGRIVGAGSPPQPLPAVNFSRDMVVYAALGTRPTSGHSAAVTAVYEAEGAYHVVVTDVRLGPGCATSPALTAAVAVVRTPQWAGEVRFVRRTGTRRCE
jgi:hypothetical protein